MRSAATISPADISKPIAPAPRVMGTASHHQPALHAVMLRHSARRPSRPSATHVTMTAATSGPANPGICVGHPTPCLNVSPATTNGIHQAHEIKYARVTKAPSGCSVAQPLSADGCLAKT